MPEGMVDLVVPVLPARILPESIYAQAADPKVKILSVRIIQRAIGEEPIEEIRDLDRQIEEVAREIKHLSAQKEQLERQWKLFEGLKDFTITAEKLDLNRKVLSFEPLQGLTDLIERKGKQYLQRSLELTDQIEQTSGWTYCRGGDPSLRLAGPGPKGRHWLPSIVLVARSR